MTDAIFSDIWSNLQNATGARSTFNFLQLATVGLDGVPQIRNIVLRRCDRDEGTLSFVTDIRSPKVSEIRANARVGMLGYDNEKSVQYRFSGVASLVADETEKLEVWRSLKRSTTEMFEASVAPTMPIDHPAEARATILEEKYAFQQFAVVKVALRRIERLELDVDFHRRAEFLRKDDRWEHRWIAP